MVKLTAELIEQAAQYTNAVRDRELDLRGELGGARAASLLGARPRGAAPPRAPRPEPGPWASRPGPGHLASTPSGPFGAVSYPPQLADTAPRFLTWSVPVRLCPACSAA